MGRSASLHDHHLDQDIRKAIQETLPPGPGQRNRMVFEFARALKAIARLADAEADDLLPYLQAWHRAALPYIRTKPFDETLIDFLTAWPSITHPKGTGPMVAIFERARQRRLPEVAQRYDSDGLRLLVALCAELQRASGDKPFFLSCRTAGQLLKVNHATAWRWLWLLNHHGVVEEVEKGDRTKRRATRFRYRGD